MENVAFSTIVNSGMIELQPIGSFLYKYEHWSRQGATPACRRTCQPSYISCSVFLDSSLDFNIVLGQLLFTRPITSSFPRFSLPTRHLVGLLGVNCKSHGRASTQRTSSHLQLPSQAQFGRNSCADKQGRFLATLHPAINRSAGGHRFPI